MAVLSVSTNSYDMHHSRAAYKTLKRVLPPVSDDLAAYRQGPSTRTECMLAVRVRIYKNGR